MKKLLLLLLFIPCVVYGQAKVGTAGAQFLEIGPSARGQAMGNMYMSVTNDVFAVYYNPGAVAANKGKELALSYIKYPADINYNFFAFTMPAYRIGGKIGFSGTALYMDQMPVRTPAHPEGTGQTFTAADYSFGLTYSRMLTDRFSVGVTAKYIGEYLADEKALGWAADIGTIYFTGFHNMRLGIAVTNFGPDMKFIDRPYPLPMNFRFSISSDIISDATNLLTVGFYGSHPADNLEKFSLGTEYWFNRMLAVRGSWEIQHDSERFSAGAGLNIPLGNFFAKADYSYTDMKYLTDIHRFTIGLQF